MELRRSISLKQDWLLFVKSLELDVALDITTGSEGNIYIAGYTEGELVPGAYKGAKDIFLAVYDSNKLEQWCEQLGTPDLDEARGVALDCEGNVYIAGYTEGSLLGETYRGRKDIFLAKYARSGDKYERKWLKQFGTFEDDIATCIVSDNECNVYIAGWTDGELLKDAQRGGADIFLAKYDNNGNEKWRTQLGSSRDDVAYDIAADNMGSVYITGYTCGELEAGAARGGADIFLAKYDSAGTKQWVRQIGSCKTDTANGIAVDHWGNVYITGYTYGDLESHAQKGAADIFLAKYTANGDQEWVRQLGTPGKDVANKVATDREGGVYITGCTYGDLETGVQKDSADVFLVKYAGNGDRQWVKQLSFSSHNEARGITIDRDGNIYLAGLTDIKTADPGESGSTKLHGDIFLVKFHEER